MDLDAFEAEWMRQVREALRIPAPADTPLPDDGILIRLVLLPSFHPWSCLTLNSSTTMAHLEIRWGGGEHRESAGLERESVLLPGARDLFFECGKWRRAKLNIEERLGMDGMTVHCAIANPMELDVYRWWSPEPDTMPGKLVARLYSMALAYAVEERTRLYLESIHGYISGALPARVIEHDDFQTLRLYDGLWMGLEDELVETFAGLDTTRAVLIDMSNFDSMGTMFYSFFRKAAKRPGTVWLLSDSAAKQFDEMKFPRDIRTQSREEAMAKLRAFTP